MNANFFIRIEHLFIVRLFDKHIINILLLYSLWSLLPVIVIFSYKNNHLQNKYQNIIFSLPQKNKHFFYNAWTLREMVFRVTSLCPAGKKKLLKPTKLLKK